MDKDVEVSKDQSTVIINGTRYMAHTPICDPSTLMVCSDCALHAASGISKEYCSFVPCCADERHDHTEVIFKAKP